MTRFSAGREGPPRKTAASLKILGVTRVKRVGLSSDLDMSLNLRVDHAAQGHNGALAFAVLAPSRERPVGGGAEVKWSIPIIESVGGSSFMVGNG